MNIRNFNGVSFPVFTLNIHSEHPEVPSTDEMRAPTKTGPTDPGDTLIFVSFTLKKMKALFITKNIYILIKFVYF